MPTPPVYVPTIQGVSLIHASTLLHLDHVRPAPPCARNASRGERVFLHLRKHQNLPAPGAFDTLCWPGAVLPARAEDAHIPRKKTLVWNGLFLFVSLRSHHTILHMLFYPPLHQLH